MPASTETVIPVSLGDSGVTFDETPTLEAWKNKLTENEGANGSDTDSDLQDSTLNTKQLMDAITGLGANMKNEMSDMRAEHKNSMNLLTT